MLTTNMLCIPLTHYGSGGKLRIAGQIRPAKLFHLVCQAFNINNVTNKSEDFFLSFFFVFTFKNESEIKVKTFFDL